MEIKYNSIPRKEVKKIFDTITSKLDEFCLYADTEQLRLIKTKTDTYHKIVNSPLRITRIVGIYNYRISFQMLVDDLEAVSIEVIK